MPDVDIKPKTDIWYCADGRDIQIRQMETSHILNCLRMIERKMRVSSMLGLFAPSWRQHFYKPLRAELQRRYERDLYLRG